MDSDSSNYYETTYSEDERIDKCVKEQREQERTIAKEKELERGIFFKNYYDENSEDADSVFNLRGIRFLKFTSKKIKFAFQPCLIARLVSKRLTFYVSFKYCYRYNYWLIGRDSIPVNYKSKIYNSFYKSEYFQCKDDNIVEGIVEMWDSLKTWALDEHKFRYNKFKKFLDGVDVYFDRDDEAIFFNNAEIEALHKKREEIWKRMLPPPKLNNMRLRRRSKRLNKETS